MSRIFACDREYFAGPLNEKGLLLHVSTAYERVFSADSGKVLPASRTSILHVCNSLERQMVHQQNFCRLGKLITRLGYLDSWISDQKIREVSTF